MTCLSVGHGQAVVLSTPSGEHYLFDAGSITHQNIASKIIVPYLQHRRIFSLDTVYISHGDLDHLNSLPDIAAMVDIQSIYGNVTFLKNAQQPSLEKSLKDELEKLGLRLSPVQDREDGEVKIHSLWPLNEFSENLSENNRSEVVLIEYAGKKILLCGDIENDAQKKILECYPSLKVDVMVLPHHGSTRNLETYFIEHLEAEVLVASCGRRNQPNAYKPNEGLTAQCFYTSVDGAVTIKIKADGAISATGFLNSTE